MAPPHRVNDRLHRLDLGGYLFPWNDELPVLVMMEDCRDVFLPLFASREALDGMMQQTTAVYTSVKEIDDQMEFIDCLPLFIADRRLRIMIDPYRAENGCIRFKELLRETMVH